MITDKNENPIGFFDSGVGGLTVFEKVKKLLPNENYLYFGDLKNIPYGEKSKDQLIEFADKIFKFFDKQGAKAVVMACNTTSAQTYEELKDLYGFKIYPIIQSCASAIAILSINKIGVFATEATIQSKAYSRELKKHNPNLQIFEQACPNWVKIVEDRTFSHPQSIELVKNHLDKMLKRQPEKIVLGCTHYPYLLDILAKFAPKEIFIDPSEIFANSIVKDFEPSKQGGSEEFFVSANPQGFKEASRMFYPIQTLPKLIDL